MPCKWLKSLPSTGALGSKIGCSGLAGRTGLAVRRAGSLVRMRPVGGTRDVMVIIVVVVAGIALIGIWRRPKKMLERDWEKKLIEMSQEVLRESDRAGIEALEKQTDVLLERVYELEERVRELEKQVTALRGVLFEAKQVVELSKRRPYGREQSEFLLALDDLEDAVREADASV